MGGKLISLAERKDAFLSLERRIHDLVVIGGGITGAGIAWQASEMGLDTVLLEMNDFASGTSSRSTKLIHGGLRYLVNKEFNLVRESGRERGKLYERMPHLIQPIDVLLPLYEKGSISRFKLRLGLGIYDFLAQVRKRDRKRMLSAGQTMKQEPLLKKNGLKGAGMYREYLTDDARLVIAVLKTAASHGAVCLNYSPVKSIEMKTASSQGAGVAGESGSVLVHDLIDGGEFRIRARKIVNATGPWVGNLDESLKAKLVFTKGVHLVFDWNGLPVKQAIYFQNTDGRFVFIIPRDGVVYVGTTDTKFEGDPADVVVDAGDVDYLLAALYSVLEGVSLNPEHVISAWAGVRVLVNQPGKEYSEISRKEEIAVHPSGLVSIAGGKLTGFRKMAWRVLTAIGYPTKGKTARFVEDADFSEFHGLAGFGELMFREGRAKKISDEWVKGWLCRYGTSVAKLIALTPAGATTETLVIIELNWCLENESVVHPADFLERRSGFVQFQPDLARQSSRRVFFRCGEILGWDVAKIELEHKKFASRYIYEQKP